VSDRVLVTGGDGFIGSHLVEHLIAAGHRVRALAYYNSLGSFGWLDTLAPDVLDEVEVVLGDVRDAAAMRRLVCGCATVYHLAALIGIPYSYEAAASYVDTNITGTLNVLEAAREHGVGRVVQTSTSEVYGTAQYVPIDEAHPLVAQSPYAATKIGADQLALSYYRSMDVPVSVCRPFNTYGPRQSTRAVIPTIITQILAGAKSIRLGALSPTRDFSYAADTAAGFAAVAAAPDAVGEVVNLGSGFEISVGDTVRLISQVLGTEVAVQEEEHRLRPALSEVNRLWADTSKAERLLDWKPRYSGREGFERGIRLTAEWFSDPQNLARYRPGTYAR
jgi:NAD dependent epimerase/dehydratase